MSDGPNEGRPKLRALPGRVEPGGGPEPASVEAGGGRRLAPGAPRSPGTVPLELARHLKMGEAVVWWNEKATISWAPVLWTALAGVLILGAVSAFAPELWQQPLRQLARPVAAVFSPALFVLAREWIGRRATVVTDAAVLDVDHRGRADRVAFRNVRRIRRDYLTGGVLLEAPDHKVRIPQTLSEDARKAVASQMRGMVRASADQPVDTLGWFPRS